MVGFSCLLLFRPEKSFNCKKWEENQ